MKFDAKRNWFTTATASRSMVGCVIVRTVVGRAIDQFNLMPKITFDSVVVLVDVDDVQVKQTITK